MVIPNFIGITYTILRGACDRYNGPDFHSSLPTDYEHVMITGRFQIVWNEAPGGLTEIHRVYDINSAHSTSSSSATADNTNNINNTSTASNSQKQSACAVAVTCPEGSTTVTPPPPTTGTLEISKVCDPGSTTACGGVKFPITVTGNNPPSLFTLSNGQTQTVTLGPGSFTVTEGPTDGFSPFFRGDCMPNGRFDATGTISAGQTLTCTITNTQTT